MDGNYLSINALLSAKSGENGDETCMMGKG